MSEKLAELTVPDTFVVILPTASLGSDRHILGLARWTTLLYSSRHVMSEEFDGIVKRSPMLSSYRSERSRFLGRVSTFERRRNGIPAVVIRPRAPRLGFGILDAEMTGNLCKCRLALMHYGWGGLWERIWVFKEVEIAQKVMEPWRDIVAGQDLEH